MNKVVAQVRDIETIENYIKAMQAGVFSFVGKNDKLIQLTKTYVYLDKNVYLFFDGEDELHEEIPLETAGCFAVIRELKVRRGGKTSSPVYKIFSIKLTGLIKSIDDLKLSDELRKMYFEKYSNNKQPDESSSENLSKVFILDTEEIYAFEETGG